MATQKKSKLPEIALKGQSKGLIKTISDDPNFWALALVDSVEFFEPAGAIRYWLVEVKLKRGLGSVRVAQEHPEAAARLALAQIADRAKKNGMAPDGGE